MRLQGKAVQRQVSQRTSSLIRYPKVQTEQENAMTPKQTIHRIFALAALATTAFLSQALSAQVATYASRVSVPFGFNCGSQHFYAGTYTIRMVSDNVMTISNGAETSMVVVMGHTGNATPAAQGYLTFRKYGPRYFLAEYHPSNDVLTATIAPSKSERSVARDFASNQADQGRVRLALLDTGMNASSGR